MVVKYQSAMSPLTPRHSHMTCKKCKWEFCWVCMGPWSEHGTSWYQCNRFDERSGIDARDTQAKSRASLERYLHVSWGGLSLSLSSLPVGSADSTRFYSTSIGGRTTSIPPNSTRTSTRPQRRRWSRCRTAATSRGSKCSSPSRQSTWSFAHASRSSGPTAWRSSGWHESDRQTPRTVG